MSDITHTALHHEIMTPLLLMIEDNEFASLKSGTHLASIWKDARDSFTRLSNPRRRSGRRVQIHEFGIALSPVWDSGSSPFISPPRSPTDAKGAERATISPNGRSTREPPSVGVFVRPSHGTSTATVASSPEEMQSTRKQWRKPRRAGQTWEGG